MIISINQPAYLPWLGYFERIAKSDLHVVLDHVQFEKNSMVNRNKINSPNGPSLLTVPVKTAKKFGDLAINNIQINNQNKWQKKHWQSIFFNYKKSDYFHLYQASLEAQYQQDWTNLNSLLKVQLKFFLSTLKITTPIIYSSELNLTKTKSELVLEICKNQNATTYLSGPFGRDYLELEAFKKNDIKVTYQDYLHPIYSQFNDTFESHLSTLDLLMHHGNEAINILRS
ncbi:hypothetical protein CJF42_22490 [Pseudoalteromonas sp. NBT06-2]|uniref:WbqC family protein n=1 Tax=Pseudoalteromonas sp. NBT06-2 TaxID=2025950 RepID=UPI000BA56145|nr:WbqC family protein [Pseudoalteromonas sp. NBT06-2]PAJ72192.1 hypothetical protein CJF42_22490 [Pseudoalteromonas sp. NBT06-2]